MTMSNKNIPNPPILKRIDDLLIRLDGADPEQIEEVLSWKKKAQDALALLSLKGNVGVAMLVAEAEVKIHEIEQWKLDLDPKDLDPVACQKLVSQIVEREHMRSMWKWFISMFASSDQDLADVEAEMREQELTTPNED